MNTTSEVAWKSFLETTPPNTSVKIQGLATGGERVQWHFKNPQIQLHCEYDDGPRRFDPTDSIFYVSRPRNYEFITYQCRDCQTINKTFAVLRVSGRLVRFCTLRP